MKIIFIVVVLALFIFLILRELCRTNKGQSVLEKFHEDEKMFRRIKRLTVLMMVSLITIIVLDLMVKIF